jgi:GNAT superfamily N-acetyltransferase
LRVWAERLSSPAENQYVLMAVDRDEVVGFVCAYGDADDRWGTLVDNLHVLPSHQGTGLGQRLLSAAAAWSLARYPSSLLHLWVLDGNAKAQGFYRRLGGRPMDSEVSVPPGGGEVLGWRYVWEDVRGLVGSG